MRKQLITAATAVALAALALSGCSSTSSSPTPSGTVTSKAPAGLIDPGTLNLCVSLSYEPLEYYSNGTSGTIVGWDVDTARALAKLWGVKLKVTTMDFSGLIPGLQAGRCDLVQSGMYVNAARVQVTDAVPVLATGSEVILSSAVAANVKTVDDLCGLRIATQSGSEDNTHLTAASSQCVKDGKPAIKIAGYPGSVDALPSIKSGKLDGLIDTTVLIATIAKQNPDLTPVPGLFAKDYWFGSFTKKGSPLSAAVKSGLDTLITNGTLAKLATKYDLNPGDVAQVDTNALG